MLGLKSHRWGFALQKKYYISQILKRKKVKFYTNFRRLLKMWHHAFLLQNNSTQITKAFVSL
jgi:hypothetical protein